MIKLLLVKRAMFGEQWRPMFDIDIFCRKHLLAVGGPVMLSHQWMSSSALF